MEDALERLVGRTIKAIYVSPCGAYLRLETDSRDLGFEAFGECCSETWFADLTGVDALLGGTVAAVEVVDLPDPTDDRGRQEYDQAYGANITTNKGRATLVFRNSSNGYYGGWLTSHAAEQATIPITDDWSA